MATPLLLLTQDYSSFLAPSPGLYLLPSPTSPFTWSGVFFLHKGFYTGLILHFQLDFPTNYPSSPPKCTILNEGGCGRFPFHPLINPETGEMKLGLVVAGEGKEGNRAGNVLRRLKDSFKVEGLERIVREKGERGDEGAFKMYTEDPATFKDLAQQSAKLSNSYAALYARRPLFQFHPPSSQADSSTTSRTPATPSPSRVR